jgi:type IV pilus assembly protein PilW
MINKLKRVQNPDGFTLVELLVALVLSGLVIWMVYSTYTIQQRTSTGQRAVSEMQQNIRAALILMTTEMKMAGLDPREHSGAGITLAAPGRFSFTMDRFDNAGNPSPDDDVNDSNEQISYGFSQAADTNDDGVPDAGNTVLALGRDVGGGYQPIAENVERLEFLYTVVGGASSLNVTPAQYKKIRSVKISLLVRTSRNDPSFSNSTTYVSAFGTNWGPFNDGYRRRLLITEVKLRNMPK